MLSVKAFAKINWTLDILGKRRDGYHEMDMLMQSVSLCDEITLEPAENLSLTLSFPDGRKTASGGVLAAGTVTADRDNLILRAAEMVRAEYGVRAGARITLEKHIPFGAGMGGGSADAAASLLAFNRMWNLEISEKELARIGLSIGADVPFQLAGGFARVRGIGEIIEPLRNAPQVWLLLCQPCEGVSTGKIFSAYDGWHGELHRPEQDKAIVSLQHGDFAALKKQAGNVLQPPLAAIKAEITAALAEMDELGAVFSSMTGSGSVVYGVFPDRESARNAGEAMRKNHADWGLWTAETLSGQDPFGCRDCNSACFIL